MRARRNTGTERASGPRSAQHSVRTHTAAHTPARTHPHTHTADGDRESRENRPRNCVCCKYRARVHFAFDVVVGHPSGRREKIGRRRRLVLGLGQVVSPATPGLKRHRFRATTKQHAQAEGTEPNAPNQEAVSYVSWKKGFAGYPPGVTHTHAPHQQADPPGGSSSCGGQAHTGAKKTPTYPTYPARRLSLCPRGSSSSSSRISNAPRTTTNPLKISPRTLWHTSRTISHRVRPAKGCPSIVGWSS